MKFTTVLLVLTAVSTMAMANDPAANPKKAELRQKMQEAKVAAQTACASDAAAAGCTGKEIGTGLMKCIHEYKKAHKDFAVSEQCKNSTKELHSDREDFKKARKEARQEAKAQKTLEKSSEKDTEKTDK